MKPLILAACISAALHLAVDENLAIIEETLLSA